MCEVYKIFSRDWEHLLDYSEQMMYELYMSESYGHKVSQNNGYFVGKRYLNVQVTMWKQDIQQGLLFKCELYDDPKYPHWWLDSVLRAL